MGTAEANGLQMHYLDAGAADEVLMLLHGGTATAMSNWEALIPMFAERFRVIAPDSRGHGGTVNDGRPLTYERAICWFFHIPDIDAPADLDGMEAGMPQTVAEMAALHSAQGASHWREVVRMVEPLFKHPPIYSEADLAGVEAPMLLLEGDRDEFLPLEGQVALHRQLRGSELAVMPGVGHGYPQRPQLYVGLVCDFLDRAFRNGETS